MDAEVEVLVIVTAKTVEKQCGRGLIHTATATVWNHLVATDTGLLCLIENISRKAALTKSVSSLIIEFAGITIIILIGYWARFTYIINDIERLVIWVLAG